ncbi:hypothetical protein [Priestia megaterium]|uniref:hypothetical protein n=1 Tax=Priestia megaterium TaxID=1404 RepID=UPI000BEB5AB4|nr:hypothetical protein [Priestia megaterium]PED64012.1 hypothetical protein CON20_23910 [Priestia megaterium]
MAKVKHYIYPDQVVREIKHGDGRIEYEYLTKEQYDNYETGKGAFVGIAYAVGFIFFIIIGIFH